MKYTSLNSIKSLLCYSWNNPGMCVLVGGGRAVNRKHHPAERCDLRFGFQSARKNLKSHEAQLLEPNLALRGLPRTSGAPKRAFWGQNEPFWGPQEYRRGPLRGQSTRYGCYHPSWTSQWQLGPNQAPLCLRRTSRAL